MKGWIKFPVIFCLSAIVVAHAYSARAGGNKDHRYYGLNLHYKTSTNSVSLADKKPVFLTDCNFNASSFHRSGSQFYACVIDAEGRPCIFKDGTDRFYLKEFILIVFWDGVDEKGKLHGGMKLLEEGDVRVSIPYFPEGRRIEIHDISNDEIVLTVDVSRFAGRRPSR